jgi:hypothetical protein
MSATTGTLIAGTTRTTSETRSTWRAGISASLVAALATLLFIVVAHALGVSLKVGPPGAHHAEAIPVLAFAQWALIWSLVGTGLAVALQRHAKHPRATFVVTTVVLTVLSFGAPITAGYTAFATKVVLSLSHVVAAAIVIPVLAARLPREGRRPAGAER